MNPNLNHAADLIDTLENRMLKHAERMADFPTEISQNDPEYLFHDWACGAYAKLHRDLYWMAANPVVVERQMAVLDNQIDISMDLEAYDLIAERMADRAEQRGR